jgi:hypothetical protein
VLIITASDASAIIVQSLVKFAALPYINLLSLPREWKVVIFALKMENGNM